jgi:hypothetical protein
VRMEVLKCVFRDFFSIAERDIRIIECLIEFDGEAGCVSFRVIVLKLRT